MSGIRLNFVVEGQTEEAFVEKLLKPHLAGRSIWVYVRCVQTSSKHNVKHRGGVVSYVQARKDLKRWMAEDRRGDVRFTTMFDLFRLPNDFPGYDASTSHGSRRRAEQLQQAMLEDINDPRLLPYIQLHEFEALILADPIHLETSHPEYRSGIHRLVETVSGFASPEEINDGPETAPSKRIAREIPTYSKTVDGPIIAARIGLPTLRTKCPHFGAWVDALEAIGPLPTTP